MNLQRRLRFSLAGGIMAMTWWICAPLQAQQPATEPETAAPAAQAIQKGPLLPHVAEKVREIVTAAIKASVPPSEQGGVGALRFEKNQVLIATVDGLTYKAIVFRPFQVEQLGPDELNVKEYYVRTADAPWQLKLKDGSVVIPMDTYLSGGVVQVIAYDADAIAAQEAAIARSEALCKAAIEQLEPARKAKIAAISEAHKADLDALVKQVTQLRTEVNQKESARNSIITQINQRPPKNAVTTRDADKKILWQWSPGQGFTFYDGLDQSRQALDKAVAAQKALQATMDSELATALGQPGAQENALRTILRKQKGRILAGETISDEDMRAEYEAATAGPLNAPPASGAQPPANAKPPIQAVPKSGT